MRISDWSSDVCSSDLQMVEAALAQVPELDPAQIDDLMLGTAQPAGEGGNNLARAVAVLAGFDRVPGVTVNRYCSSSLQRSEERREGKEGGSTCRSRWSTDN